jgi:hypothetical protein
MTHDSDYVSERMITIIPIILITKLNTNAIRENNDEAMRRNLKEFEELTQNFNKGGREEEEAKKQSIVSYLPI